MGSPAFAVPSLHALAAARYTVALAVTQPDRPAGRGGALRPPEVKLAARELGIDVFQPESLKDETAGQRLRSCEADVFVVAAYGKILPRAVLDIPRIACVNVHASLLPRWRGASPIAAAILAGDAQTGVSIMELVAKMDAGPVISRRAIPLDGSETTRSLEPRLAHLGAELLVEVLPPWLAGSLPARAQDESQATYCGLVKKEDGWLKRGMTAAEAERAVRAYDPWPGAYVLYREQRLSIWRAHVEPQSDFEPGTLVVHGHAPAIAFREGLLVVDELQRAGSRRMPGSDFVNGERGRLERSVGLA